MPIQSAERLLALHEAGKLEVTPVGSGASVSPHTTQEGVIMSYMDKGGNKKEIHYKTFVKCVGQKTVPFQNFPFKSLVQQDVVSAAALRFCSDDKGERLLSAPLYKDAGRIVKQGSYYYLPGGIAIDAKFRPLNKQRFANKRISVLALSHIMGLYAYHPGLAFCAHSAEIVARTLVESIYGSKKEWFVSSRYKWLVGAIRLLSKNKPSNVPA